MNSPARAFFYSGINRMAQLLGLRFITHRFGTFGSGGSGTGRASSDAVTRCHTLLKFSRSITLHRYIVCAA